MKEDRIMTIQACYQQMGGDYAQVQQRLPSARLIEKFVAKFLEDGSFAELRQAMQTGQREAAFRAAHTLKGVCANLSFTKLLASASRLTELLRPEADVIPAEAAALMEAVAQDYELTVSTIRAYLDSAH